MPGFLRAQVIAWYDYIKREMPDTFFVQNAAPTAARVYPINFAANPYPLSGGTTTDPAGLGIYILPMGNSIRELVPCPGRRQRRLGYSLTNNTGLMEYNPAGDGIYGAAYAVAAGIYKNLGYLPIGYDGVDNNGDGTDRRCAEGIGTPNVAPVRLTWSSADLGQSHAHHGAGGDALRPPGRGPGPAGLGLQPRTTSPTGRSRTPTTTACPSSSTPGGTRSSSSAGRSCTTPTSSAARSITPTSANAPGPSQPALRQHRTSSASRTPWT